MNLLKSACVTTSDCLVHIAFIVVILEFSLIKQRNNIYPETAFALNCLHVYLCLCVLAIREANGQHNYTGKADAGDKSCIT